LILCFLYLIAGALLSVAVAWGASIASSARVLSTAEMGVLERDDLHLVVQSLRGSYWANERFVAFWDEAAARSTPSHIGREEISQRRVPAWAIASLDSHAAELLPTPGAKGDALAISAIGWPCLCLKGTQTRFVAGRSSSSYKDEGIIRLGSRV